MARVWGGVRLGVKTLGAVYLALWVSFEALIPMAGSAGLTAAICSLPEAGAVFAKSYARLVGTVVAGVATIALYWIFPQAPWLFAGGLAIWLGLSCYVGGKIKYFGTYAAILSGFTVAIIVSNTPNPEVAMRIAGERVSVVIVGILAVAFLWGVLHIRKGIEAFFPTFHAWNDRIIAQLTQAIDHPEAYDHVATMRAWAEDIEAMHQSLCYEGAEDPEVALHASSIRCGLNENFAAMADITARLQALSLFVKATPVYRDIFQETSQGVLAAFKARWDETDAQTNARFEQLQQQLVKPFAAQSNADILMRARLSSAVDAARRVINSMNRIRRGRETIVEEDIRPLGQATTMGQNAYNAFVIGFTFFIAWGIYIVNEWTLGGPLFVVNTIALMMMTVTNEDPVALAKMMVFSAVGCALPSLIASQVLMPLGSGFPWLILSLSLIVIPCSILRVFPKTAAVGTTFMMLSLILSSPQNQMDYNLQTFLNNMLGLGSAIVLCTASALIFYPIRNRDKARAIERQGLQNFSQLKSRMKYDRFVFWEDQQQERIAMIDRIGSLKGTVVAQESIDALLVMMRLARCLRRQGEYLDSVQLAPAVRKLVDQAEWFWSRQVSSSERFQALLAKLVDALKEEGSRQPAHQLELIAASEEWHDIASNNQRLCALIC